jgi:hypothetical protein
MTAGVIRQEMERKTLDEAVSKTARRAHSFEE